MKAIIIVEENGTQLTAIRLIHEGGNDLTLMKLLGAQYPSLKMDNSMEIRIQLPMEAAIATPDSEYPDAHSSRPLISPAPIASSSS